MIISTEYEFYTRNINITAAGNDTFTEKLNDLFRIEKNE